jgi:hypothetical protein
MGYPMKGADLPPYLIRTDTVKTKAATNRNTVKKEQVLGLKGQSLGKVF